MKKILRIFLCISASYAPFAAATQSHQQTKQNRQQANRHALYQKKHPQHHPQPVAPRIPLVPDHHFLGGRNNGPNENMRELGEWAQQDLGGLPSNPDIYLRRAIVLAVLIIGGSVYQINASINRTTERLERSLSSSQRSFSFQEMDFILTTFRELKTYIDAQEQRSGKNNQYCNLTQSIK